MSLPKVFLRPIGIRTGRIRARMEESGLALRPYHLRDLAVLRSLCRRERFFADRGRQPGNFSSLFSFWKWLRITFQVFYVIDVQENDAHGIIGFLAIYNIQLGRELWLSLALFDAKDRGQGYGRRALRLLLSALQEDRLVKTVCGEVLRTNTRSLRLLQELGFEAYGYDDDRLLFRKRVGEATEAAHSRTGEQTRA